MNYLYELFNKRTLSGKKHNVPFHQFEDTWLPWRPKNLHELWKLKQGFHGTHSLENVLHIISYYLVISPSFGASHSGPVSHVFTRHKFIQVFRFVLTFCLLLVHKLVYACVDMVCRVIAVCQMTCKAGVSCERALLNRFYIKMRKPLISIGVDHDLDRELLKDHNYDC